MKRGDVWWVDFNATIGGEIQKTTPAIMSQLSNQDMQTVEHALRVPLELP